MCNADVAVKKSNGTCLAHGRKAKVMTGIDGRPYRGTDYGCHGWGQPALALEEEEDPEQEFQRLRTR